jgi:predicted nucleic-acid-binding protein
VIGLDTNVLLRFLVQDDEVQAARSARVIRQAVTRREPIVLNPVVLVEVAWVLGSSYEYSRGDIAAAFDDILDADGFEIADRDAVRAAVEDYRMSKADFADALIGRLNQRAGCRDTVTFDRRLKLLATFRVL